MEQQEKKNYGLPPKETLILEEYREQHIVFEKLLRVVKRILRESIEENKIYINAIEGRVKAEDSLAGKLERKSGKYNSLSDLTDILGVRIITFYSDEVDKVAALVGRLFEIDWENNTKSFKELIHDQEKDLLRSALEYYGTPAKAAKALRIISCASFHCGGDAAVQQTAPVIPRCPLHRIPLLQKAAAHPLQNQALLVLLPAHG